MKLYDDKAVSTLLRRASEMQARSEGGTATGLTLEELQSIAREVGIDPRYVEQAARESGRVEVKDDTFYFWGGPGRAQADRVVPGDLTDEAWEIAVSEMRRVTGQVGETSGVGRAREWRYSVLGTAMAFLSASPRKGQTVLHAEKRMDNEGVVAFLAIPMVVLSIGLITTIKFGLLALLPSIALFVLAFFGCRAIYGRGVRSARRKLDETLSRIEQTMLDAAPPQAVAASVSTPEAPRLTIPDALPQESEDPMGTQDRTRTT